MYRGIREQMRREDKPFNPVIKSLQLKSDLLKVARAPQVQMQVQTIEEKKPIPVITDFSDRCPDWNKPFEMHLEKVENTNEVLAEIITQLNNIQQNVTQVKLNNFKYRLLVERVRDFIQVFNQHDRSSHVVDEALIRLEKAVRIAESK